MILRKSIWKKESKQSLLSWMKPAVVKVDTLMANFINSYDTPGELQHHRLGNCHNLQRLVLASRQGEGVGECVGECVGGAYSPSL